MAVPHDTGVRFRLGWTALVLVIALGGAGLAVAADRQASPAQRRDVAGWLDDGAAAIAAVYEAARRVSGELQGLNVTGVEGAIAEGDAALSMLHGQLPDLMPALVSVGAPTAPVEQVAAEWQSLAARSRLVAGLLETLERHEDLVFDATTAGRAAQWTDALLRLADASTTLGEAEATRDVLAGTGDVSTLTELLERFRAYDAALVALYSYIAETGLQDGDEFDSRVQAVERAQAALPASDEVLSLIVGEVAGAQLTGALLAIDGARAAVDEARSTL